MLRWKKLKAKNATEEGPSRPPSTVSDGPEESMGGMLFENVPRSISVASSVTHPSSSSSISSDGLHVMGPLTRFSDDETTITHGVHCVSMAHRGDSTKESSESISEDSPNEYCMPVGANGAMTATNISVKGPGGQKRKHEIFRKVSDSDLSVIAHGTGATNDRASAQSPQKKERVSSVSVPSEKELLANPEDSEVLNALHVFVRKQIEVFTATPNDMAQPAPGRKNPIKLHQVGLRCIHCRHLPSRDRVKRAVCYPTSLGRVYHSVSDMKFDHFNSCRGLSQETREQLETLKIQCKRRGERKSSGGSTTGSSSSTAQYYHDAARKMGMVDGRGGIFLAHNMERQQSIGSPVKSASPPSASPLQTHLFDASRQLSRSFSLQGSQPTLPAHVLAMYQPLPPAYTAPLTNTGSHSTPRSLIYPMLNVSQSTSTRPQSVLLSSPLDQQFLNPIHCFVRRNVEVFIATEEDIAAPAPGRKTRLTIGQVGLRCIHCARLPVKDRVKRAVCYPPSVSGIYHSVSNMKFDHFGKCQRLPAEARAEFATLKESCSRRGSSNASRGGVSNSTAQYYHDSALRLGLVDTNMGIRFREQRLMSEAVKARGAGVPDGISALMMAATNPSIRAEYDQRRQVKV